MESRHLLNLSVQNVLGCISDNFNLNNFPEEHAPETPSKSVPFAVLMGAILPILPPYHKILHPPMKDAICIKGTVKRATKTGNLNCNIGAKRIEWRFCAFYHPRVNFVLQQTGLLQRAERNYTFCNKICSCCFTCPRQTCFAGSD